MKQYRAQFFQWLEQHEVLILLLSFQLLLRIPTFFEPYWYGDEAIYLTIGAALRSGTRLYSEIIDHKTPLIYYFAMTPTQVWFRVLLALWTSISTTCLLMITRSLNFSRLNQVFTTGLFVLLTTLPWLEGNIPNGELFVMGFILLGMTLFTRTTDFHSFLLSRKIQHPHKKHLLMYAATGFLFGLATLTKVPALFELFPLGMVAVLIALTSTHKTITARLSHFLTSVLMLGFGWMLPILLSLLYFWLRGSLSAYLEYGLLYNFHYTQNWGIPYTHPLIVFLFSLRGKVLILGSVSLATVLIHRYVSRRLLFVTWWCLATLFAATLSSRPYPHYLLQVVPSAVILIGCGIAEKKQWGNALLMGVLFGSIFAVYRILGFHPYNSRAYYRSFWEMLSAQQPLASYQRQFNPFVAENERVSQILNTSADPYTFIWGTNPMLYALSGKHPLGPFTVSFHIKDIPGAFERTFDAIATYKPEFIVIMKDETIETFPQLNMFVDEQYIPFSTFEHMTIYRKRRAGGV